MFSPLKHQPRRKTSARTPRAHCRPRLETLDDRCLLSAGAIDPTFGSGGIVTTTIGPATNENGAGLHSRARLRRDLAFVGLSQVRESAVFSGIPIVERLAEDQRTCGVCAIDLATGQVVALLRFETGVLEIFAVTVLPGKRYPNLINDD